MTDWFRSLGVLAVAFGAVVVVTLGLTVLIVPSPAGSSGASDASSPSVGDPEVPPGTTGLGGALTVTGDRQNTFRLTREAVEDRYSLVGDQGRIAFAERRPVEITQISFDGLEFFPEPDACTITPGDLDDRAGIGLAELRCEDLADVRDNATITLVGTIGLPLDMLADSDLPASGGTVDVGGEAWEFAEALLLGFPLPAGGDVLYNMELEADEGGASINFVYDHVTHQLTLANVGRDGQDRDVPNEACELREREIGKPNPRTTVIELTISCGGVEVPGLGRVSIAGTVIVDRVESPTQG
jgi:hypothetical protein